jgi:hypothetical protein
MKENGESKINLFFQAAKYNEKNNQNLMSISQIYDFFVINRCRDLPWGNF